MADTKAEENIDAILKATYSWWNKVGFVEYEDFAVDLKSDIMSEIAKAKEELLDELEIVLQPTMKSNSDNEYMRIGHNAAMKNTLAIIHAARKRIGEEKR